MKTGSFWSWSLGIGLLALPLIGGCLHTVPPPPKTVASIEPTVIEIDPGIPLPAQPGTPSNSPPPQVSAEEAAVRPLPAEFALPPNVQAGKSLAALIQMAQAGADTGAMLAFVTNSPNTFTPRADDIVYLKDIGVPESVVTAMLQRDEQLKAGTAGAAGAPAPMVMTGTNAAAPVPYAAAPTAVPGSALPPAPPSVEYVPESAAPPPPEEGVVYPDFYDSLAPYGSWVMVEGYGYCWQPAVCGVRPGWAPYYDGGHWVYTDCGWYWMSDYSWGWAPFHYGRWFHHHHWGWCWQPDRVWAPAWVCWRHNDTHCGWAPLPPGVHFSAGTGLRDQHHLVAQLSPQHFQFVEWSHFRDHSLAQHGVSHEQATRVYNQTVAVTHFTATHGRVINDGLSPDRVAVATHSTVARVTLRDVQPTATAGSRADQLATNGRTLSVYRPQVTPARVTQPTAPTRVPTKPLTVSTTGTGSAVTRTPQTVTPPQSQPNSAAHSYRAASKYYPTPGTTPAEARPDTPHTRLQTPKVTTREVPQDSPPVAERVSRDWPDNSRARVQVPAAAAPPAPQHSAPAVLQHSAPTAPQHSAPAAAQHSAPATVERPHREAAPVERPSRTEPAESRASHSAPAPAAPASRSSSSDRSDRSDRSDSGSRGRR